MISVCLLIASSSSSHKPAFRLSRKRKMPKFWRLGFLQKFKRGRSVNSWYSFNGQLWHIRMHNSKCAAFPSKHLHDMNDWRMADKDLKYLNRYTSVWALWCIGNEKNSCRLRPWHCLHFSELWYDLNCELGQSVTTVAVVTAGATISHDVIAVCRALFSSGRQVAWSSFCCLSYSRLVAPLLPSQFHLYVRLSH